MSTPEKRTFDGASWSYGVNYAAIPGCVWILVVVVAEVGAVDSMNPRWPAVVFDRF